MSRQNIFLDVIFTSILLLTALVHPGLHTTLGNIATHLTPQSRSTLREIPNIVHYVHVVPPPAGPKAKLQFSFRQFVSYYSAQFYLNPDIYIHTNADPESIKQARTSSDQWTRAVANLPSVKFRYYDNIHLAHQSVFIRTKVVTKYGGVYLDEDMYIVKDLADLRRAGFRTVLGLGRYRGIIPGMFLGMPGSELIKLYGSLQDAAFDGEWTTARVDLLTRLVPLFAGRPHEVLILDERSFFPLSWEDWGIKELYEIHEDDGEPDPYIFEDARDLKYNATFVQDFKFEPQPKTWRFDWRYTYAVHGWNDALKGKEALWGDFGDLTLDYVLAQNSNFARAVYRAVKQALDEGVIVREPYS